MNKKRYLLVAILGLLLTTATVSATTLAFGGQRGNLNGFPADTTKERPAVSATQQAIINNDYTTWQQAMTTEVANMRQRASDLEAKINQDTFNKLTQAHQLMQAGKRDEAKAIFDELGIFGPMGHMRGMGFRGNAAASSSQTTE